MIQKDFFDSIGQSRRFRDTPKESGCHPITDIRRQHLKHHDVTKVGWPRPVRSNFAQNSYSAASINSYFTPQAQDRIGYQHGSSASNLRVSLLREVSRDFSRLFLGRTMLSALFKTPLWVRLRFVSNSTAAKATILVPVIGYLIIFNEKVVDFLNLAKAVEAHNGAEVSYRLILIYLGLCAISLGVIVYGWFCPNEVKQYGSASAYVQEDGPSLRGFVIDDIGKLLENSAQRPRLQIISDALQEKVRRSIQTDEDSERYRIEMLHLHFEYLNSSHGIARAICLWSYVVGFGLLAIPSVIVFKRVIGILIGMIF